MVVASSRIHWVDDGARTRAQRRFAELRDLLAADPSNDGALRQALRLARRLDWPNESCDLLGRLVLLNPDDIELRAALATELMRLERWIEALPHLRRVTRARPRDPQAWYNLAIAHQAAGHLTEALRAWTEVIELDPASADAWARRGEVQLDLRRWSSAAADFEQALRLDADLVDAALNLALTRSRLGQYEQARAVLLPLLDRHPRNIFILNRLAQVAWSRTCDSPPDAAGARETARWCRRSLDIVAAQPEIRDLLARAIEAAESAP